MEQVKKLQSTDTTPKADEPLVVTLAQLQAPVMLPGGFTENNLSSVKIRGIKMFWIKGEGILVRMDGFPDSFVPAMNVKLVVMAK